MSLKEAVKRVIAKKKDPEMGNAMHWITEKSEKISKEEKKKLNSEITKEGMDGNGRFVKVEHAIAKIGDILEKQGLEYSNLPDSYLFKPESGTITFRVSRTTAEEGKPIEIVNSMVSFSWHLMGSPAQDKYDRKYEIVAYMS